MAPTGSQEWPASVKVVMLGSPQCGKTSLITAFADPNYRADPAGFTPSSYGGYGTEHIVDGERVRLGVFDSNGSQEDNHKRLRPLAFPQTDVFLLCFSVVNEDQLNDVKSQFAEEIRQHCPEAPFILVGTQSDLRVDPKAIQDLHSSGVRILRQEDYRMTAQKLGADNYIETSALTREGVDRLMEEMLRLALRRQKGSAKSNLKKLREKLSLSCLIV